MLSANTPLVFGAFVVRASGCIRASWNLAKLSAPDPEIPASFCSARRILAMSILRPPWVKLPVGSCLFRGNPWFKPEKSFKAVTISFSPENNDLSCRAAAWAAAASCAVFSVCSSCPASTSSFVASSWRNSFHAVIKSLTLPVKFDFRSTPRSAAFWRKVSNSAVISSGCFCKSSKRRFNWEILSSVSWIDEDVERIVSCKVLTAVFASSAFLFAASTLLPHLSYAHTPASTAAPKTNIAPPVFTKDIKPPPNIVVARALAAV